MAAFRKDYWASNRKLLAYRAAASLEDAKWLRQEFADLIAQRTGCVA
ncbi:MAG: hypothetical protein ACJ8CR_36205 [Roseiflexaceae bacterium]